MALKRIGILSDTHGSLPEVLPDFFKYVDEIWHAGDIGSIEVVNKLSDFKIFRAVHGNIDDNKIRMMVSDQLLFDCQGMKVLITHIGGYPGRYDAKARQAIDEHKPGLFVCGHSHILKVMFDQKFNLLHINPGAAGNSGFHTQITMIRCAIEDGRVINLEVYDSPRR